MSGELASVIMSTAESMLALQSPARQACPTLDTAREMVEHASSLWRFATRLADERAISTGELISMSALTKRIDSEFGLAWRLFTADSTWRADSP